MPSPTMRRRACESLRLSRVMDPAESVGQGPNRFLEGLRCPVAVVCIREGEHPAEGLGGCRWLLGPGPIVRPSVVLRVR